MADADIVSNIGESGDDGRPAGTKRASRRRGSRDPKVFVLDRELSEVHLLLDNVSANPSTTLAERLASTQGFEDDLPDDWIEQVCRISWPPDGTDDDKAEDAALLIKAKDRLNRLSYPASGSTIAFTLLVTQHDTRSQPWLRLGGGGGGEEASPTRNSLAQTAYPDLMPKAVRFRTGMRTISIALVVALFVTCLLSWYVAYGNSALAEYASAQTVYVAANKRVNDAEGTEDDPVAGDGAAAATGVGAAKDLSGDAAASTPSTSVPGGAAAPGVGAAKDPSGEAAAPARSTSVPGGKFLPYCERGVSSAAQAQACTARAEAETDLKRVKRRLAGWVCLVTFSCVKDLSSYEDLVSPRLAKDAEPTPDQAKLLMQIRRGQRAGLANDELIANAPSRAAALANIMATAVLPFLYGLLGAGAAIIRSLSRKIRASLLSPRDLHLSFQQLALGAVVGACIGLFIAAPGGPGEGESLLGPVTLSASAISFVAGFGVDSVFEALETLIKRIFNVAQPAVGNRGDGVANS
jgi:hypothetical protein